jgi:hypothetical protein
MIFGVLYLDILWTILPEERGDFQNANGFHA